VDPADARVHPLPVKVGHHDRHLEPAHEQQGELAGHQAGPNDADLADRTGQCLVRCTGRMAGPLLHQVERIQPGPQLRAHQQVGEGLVLGGEPGVSVGGPGGFDQVECPVRRGRGAVQPGVDGGSTLGDGGFPGVTAVDLGTPYGDSAREHLRRPPQRPLEKVGTTEHRVGDPSVEDLATVEHGVLVEGVVHDDLDRSIRPDQVRQQVGAAPPGHHAEEHLGQGDRPGGVQHGAELAVQGQLEAAAERGAVDVAKGRLAAVAEPAHHSVTQPGDDLGLLPSMDLGHPGEVGPGREHERLAGDADRGNPVTGKGVADRRVEGGQAARAEGVRLRVVVSVVQGDQGHRAGAQWQLDVAAERGGHHLVVGRERCGLLEQVVQGCVHEVNPVQRGFSQTTVAPMPSPTHIVVMP